MDLFIVIGRQGDWSDRIEWVAGVYATAGEAIGVAQAKLREAKAAFAARDEWERLYRSRTPKESFLARVREAYEAQHGPCPPPGDADDYTVVRARLGEWARAQDVPG